MDKQLTLWSRGKRKQASPQLDGADLLEALFDDVSDELHINALTHASWAERRSQTYERLAFLGDSVLSLAVTTRLFVELDPDEFGAGRLTEVRAQAVSGKACRSVAERMRLPERLVAAAPDGPERNAARDLVGSERILASSLEAVIGACYLHHGYERTAVAVVAAFAAEVEDSIERPEDYKSLLQEELARTGSAVVYRVVAESGPPHARHFEVAATVDSSELGRGEGTSKKRAEQLAAREALQRIAK